MRPDSQQKKRWPTRAEQAYFNIQKIIYANADISDAVLVEADLVRALGMSRTPIRDALHRLEAEGLLNAIPRGGYAIVKYDDNDLRDLYIIRATLEGLAARLSAPRLTRVDLARFDDLYDSMSEALENHEDSRLALLNREFHRTLATASNNTHLVQMLEEVKEVFERFRSKAVSDDARRQAAHIEHGQIITALRSHNAEQAREIAEQHVLRAFAEGAHLPIDGLTVVSSNSDVQ